MPRSQRGRKRKGNIRTDNAGAESNRSGLDSDWELDVTIARAGVEILAELASCGDDFAGRRVNVDKKRGLACLRELADAAASGSELARRSLREAAAQVQRRVGGLLAAYER